MTIKRKHQQIRLAKGVTLDLYEANWDASMELRAIEAQAREARASLNGQGEPELLYFHERIFAPLAACSTGDVPAVEQAFQLPPAVLDAWFEAARTVNPDWFESPGAEPETVTFRDGSKITVVPAQVPSVLMKLHRMESEAAQGRPAESVSTETFRMLYYPRLAACSTGDVPTAVQARVEWPASELDRWYQAARRVNPQLFLPLEEIALQNQQAAQASEKKRKRSRGKSSSS